MEYAKFKNTTDTPLKAVAVFQGTIAGSVQFMEDIDNGVTIIKVYITGLRKGLYGFHVHESGDLTEGCKSLCAHFNPFNKQHGCPGKINRHVGDLGNLIVNSDGLADYTFYDDHVKLRGPANVIGRGLVIHESKDDCGDGTGDRRAESLKTGNAGARIACAIIGYSKGCK